MKLAVSMPWPKTDGLPTEVATVSSWCIGLKSPEAPAYRTKFVRVRFSTTSGGAASPTEMSSKAGAGLGSIG